jgi:hypothetical protein
MAEINNEQIGMIFDDATTLLVGGVDASNFQAITNDLKTVQADMAAISAGDGEGTLTELHYDVMEHQLNQEILAVSQAFHHTNDFAAKTINDIHRDILDIFLGDPNLVAEKGNAWTPLPPLANPPTPFADSAKQTTFLSNFITDSNTLADRALGGENSDQLINDLQHFVAQSDKFVMGHAQMTTVFNARFENEIGAEGTAGTAANSLIEGLQNHVIQAATGSTAPFIALQGGNGHHDDQQSANVQNTGEDVGHHSDNEHHSDLASAVAHFWHHM